MKRLLVLMVFLIFISSAYAQPPTFQVSDTSLNIEVPHISVIKAGAEHRFHANVVNTTMSKTNATTTCSLKIYNSTGWDIDIGSQFMEFETNDIDFAKTINGKNFTKSGQYAYVVQCNSTNEIGFYENVFEVTPTGIEPTIQRTLTTTFSIFTMFLVSVMLFLGFIFINNNPIRFSVVTLSIIFFLVGINLILNLLTNEVVDPQMITLFDFISAASYYFYWLGGGLVLIVLFLTGLTYIKDVISRNKVDKYGGIE